MAVKRLVYLRVRIVPSRISGFRRLTIQLHSYTRVETLSGFANGIFLCLISIFIVFEAIERLIDPPEMNTGQLLTVSAVGLAVNLVGMVATGHAHGGHSHGGGGGHSHGHSHVRPASSSRTVPSLTSSMLQAPVKSKVTPFLTEKEEEEEDHHGHSVRPRFHASKALRLRRRLNCSTMAMALTTLTRIQHRPAPNLIPTPTPTLTRSPPPPLSLLPLTSARLRTRMRTHTRHLTAHIRMRTTVTMAATTTTSTRMMSTLLRTADTATI